MPVPDDSDCAADAHARRIAAMFDEITPWYDKQNHIFSLGVDIWWRHCLCKEVAPSSAGSTGKVLDLAAGTLDVTIALAKRYPQLQIIAADISAAMLKHGYEKKVHIADRARITTLAADARKLPLQDNCVDAVTIAFGIRNVQPRADALAEMLRVLIPGGRACVLEFAPVRKPIIGTLYHWYVAGLMPRLSNLIRLLDRDRADKGGSGVYESMRYLADSIEAFPNPADFTQELRAAGFASVHHKALTFGLANLHIAIKG